MEDRRVKRTKKAIEKAFLSLIKEKDLNQITVAELSRRADLGRGTFYLHYQDVYDLYNHLENELYQELVEIFEKSFPSARPENNMNLINTIVRYIEERKDIFLILLQRDGGGKPLRKLNRILSKSVLWEDPSQSPSEYDAVESVFVVSGVIGVLDEWLLSGLTMPREQVAAHLHRILLKFSPPQYLT